MDKKFPLKDQLFNELKVKKIAREIHNIYPEFDSTNFIKRIIGKFPVLELTPRIKWISENLKVFLPDDYRKATSILLASLPSHNDYNQTDNDFGDFIYAPYSDFVAQYGCNKKDLHFSLEALQAMTARFSAEDAIRYFINAFPKETINELQKWSLDSDFHVRRLVSEGTRPKLPWSQKITISIKEALPILDNLFSDKSRFVTRSVANHLNDISKINPELVFTTLKKWRESGKQNPKEMEYIINQALRTLIKLGDKGAIEFLNLSINPKVAISGFRITNNPITIGECLEFVFTLTAKKDEPLLIDYILYFQNKSGNGHNKKVFKLKRINMKKNQKLAIVKKQLMKNMSTRKLYPGEHKIEIQMNGKKLAGKKFNLKAI